MRPLLTRILPCILCLPWSLLVAESRVPWTTSEVHGSPEPPPPYAAELVWPHITFDGGLDLVLLEPEGRFFIPERWGKIFTVPADLSATPKAPALSINMKEAIPGFFNNRGIAFHPDFTKNRQAFLHYIVHDANKAQVNRISRFTVNETLQIVPESEEILLTAVGNGHTGGGMLFGPDGMLYFGFGDFDAPSPPDHKLVGQDVSNLASTICRIDVDRRDPGKSYAVPKDNPFVGVDGARPEIWAFGFRNPWKLCFDPADGSLWTGDVGWELWEMVYRVEKGANYGWSMVEGPAVILPNQKRGPAPISPPAHSYPHTEGASVTGGLFMQSSRLPDLKGAYIYGDFVTGKVWALRHDGKTVTSNREIADTRKQIVTFGQLPDGDLIFLDWEKGQHLYRFVPQPTEEARGSFPTHLSATGIFADTPAGDPAPGVYEFKIRAPMWQDGAASRYWVGVPGDGGFTTRIPKPRGSPLLNFEKPDDTVLAKTISRDGRRIETQVLHYDGYWRGYSYRWNDAQTDAELVPKAGLDATVGGKPWRFHSRAECVRCHGGNFHRPFAFLPGQVNRDGQLERLLGLGLVDRKFVEAAASQELANPHDEAAPLERRARSWLHANCASCHRISGGGALATRLNVAVPTPEMDLLDFAPTKGDFGIGNAKLVVPGDPYRSILYYRIATQGAGHMPMIGSRSVDYDGVRVVHDWIRSLAPDLAVAAPNSPPKSVPEALAVYHEISAGACTPEQRAQLLKSCQSSAHPMILNLFYGISE